MAQTSTQVVCPNCGGTMQFDPQAGKLKCIFCDSLFTQEEAEAFFNQQNEEEEIKESGSDWGDLAEGMRAYSCNTCGAEIICDQNTAAPQDATVKAGKVEDAWMRGLSCINGKNETWDYGLVKIGNYVWTRDDNNELILHKNDRYNKRGASYSVVDGWHTATVAEFNDMKQLLVKNGASMPTLMMYNDNSNKAQDLTGLNISFDDRMNREQVQWYWFAKNPNGVSMTMGCFWKNGQITGTVTGNEQASEPSDGLAHVRMVMNY